MQRAIELARQAEGCTSPNPLVGCVVVKDNVVVGSGWHRAAGQAHAEAEALQQAGDASRGATLYVSLEPCCHHGRTPPCTDAIKAAGIRRVFYAANDINPRARGGAKLLQDAGIETRQGVLSEQARHLNRFYFHHTSTGLPYVVAKFATSLDGRIATRTGNSQWITGDAARQRGHGLRQAVDAIVVGAQTVIDDNPRLTVRLDKAAGEARHPLRIVLDGTARAPLDSHVFSSELDGNTLLVTTTEIPQQTAATLAQHGVEVLRLPAAADSGSEHRVDIPNLLQVLGARGIQSIMVEGGPTLLGSFCDAGAINEVWAFLATKLIGGRDAPAAIGGLGIDQLSAAVQLADVRVEQLGEDILIQARAVSGDTDE